MKKEQEEAVTNLIKLIDEIEEKDRKKGLSDKYLRDHGYLTREDIGIGEYSYGIITVPVDFILPYLKELRNIWKKG